MSFVHEVVFHFSNRSLDRIFEDVYVALSINDVLSARPGVFECAYKILDFLDTVGGEKPFGLNEPRNVAPRSLHACRNCGGVLDVPNTGFSYLCQYCDSSLFTADTHCVDRDELHPYPLSALYYRLVPHHPGARFPLTTRGNIASRKVATSLILTALYVRSELPAQPDLPSDVTPGAGVTSLLTEGVTGPPDAVTASWGANIVASVPSAAAVAHLPPHSDRAHIAANALRVACALDGARSLSLGGVAASGLCLSAVRVFDVAAAARRHAPEYAVELWNVLRRYASGSGTTQQGDTNATTTVGWHVCPILTGLGAVLGAIAPVTTAHATVAAAAPSPLLEGVAGAAAGPPIPAAIAASGGVLSSTAARSAGASGGDGAPIRIPAVVSDSLLDALAAAAIDERVAVLGYVVEPRTPAPPAGGMAVDEPMHALPPAAGAAKCSLVFFACVGVSWREGPTSLAAALRNMDEQVGHYDALIAASTVGAS